MGGGRGVSAVGALLDDAEEVAVRIGEDGEVLARGGGAGMAGRPEGEETLRLGGLVGRVEVELFRVDDLHQRPMDPVQSQPKSIGRLE